METCSSCHKMLPRGATVCLKCGADLRPSWTLRFLAIGSVLLVAATLWFETHL